jgi:uncharacterized membrane protein
MIVGIALHILAAVLWVGGMYFAMMVLSPIVAQLEPSVRLPLWHRALSRFFPLVWLSIAVLLTSGFAMVIFGLGGFSAVSAYIRVMAIIGILMVAVFTYVYFVPWRTLGEAVQNAEWGSAERIVGRIRLFVTLDLILGAVTVVIGASGRYYG